MSSNLDRMKKDLDRLIEQGRKLQLSMLKESGVLTKEQVEKHKDQFMEFPIYYQAWYSESLEVVRRLLPNRLDDFKALYKSKDKRKSVDYENYTIADYLIGLKTTRGYEIVVDSKAAIPKFQQQYRVLESAKDRFESSLFDIKQIVQADIFDSEVDAARHLNKNGYTRAAGAVAGVVIEAHLQQVCDNHAVKITKKDPGINDLAQPLKDAGVIEMAEWRKIQHLADLRNLCDHKKTQEPTKEQIDDLIAGTDKLIKTVF